MNLDLYHRLLAGEPCAAQLAPRALWKLSGPDATRYLNGQVTNDVTQLKDGQALYGFSDPYQRSLFDLLTEVKGCGPKIGLSLLSELGADGLEEAILHQDPRSLARATGVGPRLADRLILELKDKIGQEASRRRTMAVVSGGRPVASVPNDPLIEALMGLGYRRAEAELAAVRARDESLELEEQIRIALRGLAK